MTQVLETQEQSPAVTNFIESLSNSKATRDAYIENLRMFMKFFNVDDAEELLKWDPKIIENRIIEYIISARKRGRAQRLLNMYFSILKKFFKINDVNTGINWDRIKMFVGKTNGKKANDRPYTHQEIHKLLEGATFRQKVIVLLMCSAGLRSGVIPSLKVGHLQKIEKYNIYRIQVYAGTDDEYTTYCTLECAAAIDSYLEFRKTRLSEQITEDSPLVINLENKEGRRNRGKENVSEPITVENVKQVTYRLLRDVGLRNAQNKKLMYSGDRHVTATCHSLRKFMRTQLKNAGVDHLHAETHSTGLVGVYTKIEDEQELLDAYLLAVNHLTINEENRLREKVRTLTAEQDRIIKKLNKIDALAEKLGITDEE
jgi:integrase